MSKIAIFASGAGSNARQIIEYLRKKNSSIQVDCIICNKENAGVLEVSRALNVPFFYFTNDLFVSGTELQNHLNNRGVEWIVLAGFLRKIAPSMINAFKDKIINIHPSLLPSYGGKGMYGDYVHQAVLEAKEKESGISIHLVNEKFDEGRILFQKSCKIDADETVESLSKKIHELEHQYYPRVIEAIINQDNEDRV